MPVCRLFKAGTTLAVDPTAQTQGSGSAVPAAPNGADTDRDGRCRGACVLLTISLPLWRVAFRDLRAFSAMIYSVLASRAYNTTPVVTDIGNLVLQVLGRLSLFVWMGGGTGC